jgi:hypothetical protein
VHGHWAGVENRNHWRRDACLGEDRTRSRNANVLINLALFAQRHPVSTKSPRSATETFPGRPAPIDPLGLDFRPAAVIEWVWFTHPCSV